MFFKVYGINAYEDLVCLYYASFEVSQKNGELETLMLGIRIVLNNFLFEKVFETDSSRDIPCMNSVWLNDFEVLFEDSKRVVAESGIDVSDFGPLSPYFENKILSPIVATTLVPRKSSLSSISTKYLFLL